MKNAILLTKQLLVGAALCALLNKKFDHVQMVDDERSAVTAMKDGNFSLLVIDEITIKGPLTRIEGAMAMGSVPVLVVTGKRVDMPEDKIKNVLIEGEICISILDTGEKFLEVAGRLAEQCASSAGYQRGGRRRYGPHKLTKREFDVASLVAKGLSNRGIAIASGLQEQSVKNLVSVIMRKLNCENRVQVALKLTGNSEAYVS